MSPNAQASPSSSGAAEDAQPFFVVGADRSGTTLLRLMLNQHPRLHIPRESGFVSDLMDVFPPARPLSDVEIRLAAEIVTRHWRWKDWEIPDESVRAELQAAAGAGLAEVVDRVFRIGAARRGKPRWGDKTPAYVEEIERLHGLFPRARFLHIVRDGRDVCSSLRRLEWRGRTILDVARYWSGAVRTALAAGRKLAPELYCELTYEDLVLRTEEALRRVCAFLGEPFDGRMLQFHEAAPREIAAWESSIHAKVVRPPEPSDVRRWTREMSRTDLALFEALAGPALEAAGYVPHFRRSAGLQRAVAGVVFGAARVARAAGFSPDWRGVFTRRRSPAPGHGSARAGGPPVWQWESADARMDVARDVEWNGLAHARSPSLFSDAIWVRAFRNAFLGGERLFVHRGSRDGTVAAVLPLRKTRLGGVLPAWSVLENSHTPGLTLAMDESLPEVYGRALDHLLRSAAAVDFGRLRVAGTPCQRLVAAARRRQLRVVLQPAKGKVFIDLTSPWARQRSSLSRSLRKHTERAERRLREKGTLLFCVTQDEGALAPVLEECLALETLGWKGERGSPMKSRRDTFRFYTDLATAAAAAGRLALYTLRLDSRLIAFEYCLRAQGQIALLKISFDPAFAKYSPGQVLRLEILRRESDLGEITTYDMGPEDAWKLPWATRVEPVTRLRVYGPGLIAAAGYAADPGLRALLGRYQTVRGLARRLLDARDARRRRRRRDRPL